MTSEAIHSILDTLRKEEYNDFLNLAPQVFKDGCNIVDLEEYDLCCNVEIFHLDDQVKCGQVCKIMKVIGDGDDFRYDDNELHYDIIFTNFNNDKWCEDVRQLCVGELTSVNEALQAYIS